MVQIAGDTLLQFGDAAVALGLDLLFHLTVEFVSRGAFLGGIEEGGGVVEAGLFHKLQQLLELLLRLPRKTDDEGGAQPHARNALAQLDQQIQGLPAGGGSLHALQHRVGDMLEGHIDVRADLGVVGKEGNHLLGPEGRVGVHQPQPLDTLDGAQLFHEGHQLGPPVQVGPITHRVLGDQHQLAHPAAGQTAGLLHQLVDGFAVVLAADGGDGAKGALMVATVGDAQVSPVARGQLQPGRTVDIGGPGLAQGAVHMGGDVGLFGQGEDLVGLGQLDLQFLLVALSQAAGGDHGLAAALGLEAVGFEDGLDGLLLGRADEAAGVHHHHVGLERV